MIKYFRAVNYRSIRDLWLNVKPINVIVGPNGSGKTNLYRSLYLLHCAARGQISEALVSEGGFKSATWCGPVDKRNAKLKPKIKLSANVDDFEHHLWLGLTPGLADEETGNTAMRPGLFNKDPIIRREDIFHFKNGVRSQLLKRRIMSIEARTHTNLLSDFTTKVLEMESVLAALRDPLQYPYLYAFRERLLDWRFYHQFRTDRHSPLRRPQLGVLTPKLGNDGSDLIATLGTIQALNEIENLDCDLTLNSAIENAFPGAKLIIYRDAFNLMSMKLQMPGLLRPFNGDELSDGTLKYLCLCAALLSPRPASMLAFNEPEQSLHPSLLEPLARLIVASSQRSQIWITTHSQELADYVLDFSGYEPIELEKVRGATRLVGVGLGGYREPPAESDELDEDEDGFDPLDENSELLE